MLSCAASVTTRIHKIQFWGLCYTWPGELAAGDFTGKSALLDLNSSAGLQSVAIAAICHPLEPYLLQTAMFNILVLQAGKAACALVMNV